MRIANYEKKIPLTNEKNKCYEKKKVYYICKKEFNSDDDVDEDDNRKYHKVGGYCLYTRKFKGAAHNICHLRYKTKDYSSIS